MRHLALLVVLLLLAGCASPRFTTRSPRPAAENRDFVAVVVRIPMPCYAPRFVVRGKFEEALPEYEDDEAIVAKYFSITDDRRFGGLYLWSSRAAAERHFDVAWRAEVEKRRGAKPDVVILAAPIVVDGPALPLGSPIGRRSMTYPAAATFVRWTTTDGSPAAARAIAASLEAHAGLVRAFVLRDGRTVGTIAIWATRDLADAAVESTRLRRLGARIGAGEATVVRLEAPLLVDATLREAAAEAGAR